MGQVKRPFESLCEQHRNSLCESLHEFIGRTHLPEPGLQHPQTRNERLLPLKRTLLCHPVCPHPLKLLNVHENLLQLQVHSRHHRHVSRHLAKALHTVSHSHKSRRVLAPYMEAKHGPDLVLFCLALHMVVRGAFKLPNPRAAYHRALVLKHPS